MKRIFTFCTAVFLTFLAAEAQAQTGITGACTWTLTGVAPNYTLTISGTGAMENYSYGSPPWFSYLSNIKTLDIQPGVTTIGDYAFSECTGLTSVTIPNTVTSIGNMAFQNCSGLTSVTIGNLVTAIGNQAFRSCTGLTSVTIPHLVNSIGNHAFAQCSGLTTIYVHRSTPPTLGNFVFDGVNACTLYVPAGSSSNYSGEEKWENFEIVEGIFTIDITGSTVQTKLPGETITNVVSLKITGTMMDAADFYYIRDNMTTTLHVLDLSEVTVSGNAIPNNALDNCSGLQSFAFPDGVTSIGEYAFYNCSNLTGALTIPNSVNTIGDHAFNGCNGFNGALTIGTSVTTIGNEAFRYCSGLNSVTIGTSVTSIGNGAFDGCSNLTGALTIPDEVTTIGEYAFYGCSSLDSVTIGNSVNTIGDNAFYDCSGLTAINVDDANTAYASEDGVLFNNAKTTLIKCPAGKTGNYAIPNSVTTIGNAAFYACIYLTDALTIPNEVTTIGSQAFYGCNGFTGALTIPNSVTTIDDFAFEGCSNLNSVTIGNSVDTIGYYAFSNCSGLDSVTIPNSVNTIGNNAFENCDGLTAIYARKLVPPSLGANVFTGVNSCMLYVPAGSSSAYSTTEQWDAFEIVEVIFTIDISNSTVATELDAALNDAGKTAADVDSLKITGSTPMTTADFEYIRDSMAITLHELDLSEVSVTDNTIPNNALQDCIGLQSFAFPDGVTAIGDFAFYGCVGLSSVTIPDSVTSIGYAAFTNCSSLTGALTIPHSVTTIGASAFSGCTDLTSVAIPNSVTTIGDGPFSNCSDLTAINVAVDNAAYVSDNGVLFNNAKTTLIQYPAGKIDDYVIPTSVNTIGASAFSNCSGLDSVTIGNSVNTIGDFAFSGCSGLSSVTIPTQITSIGNYVFRNCTNLTSVTIPNSVTSIGNQAFRSCSDLTSVTIPNSVISIGEQAFRNCSDLSAIYVHRSTPPTLGNNVFDGVDTTTCTLYVPAGSETSYAVADQWKNFNRMEVTGVTVQVELRNSSNSVVDASATRVLFYRTDAGEVEAYAAERVGAGSYRAILPAGSYIVAAENAPAGYLTTYYDAVTHGVTRWHDADVLPIAEEDSESTITITITMAAVPKDIETGTVTIDGYVYEEGTQKARVARNASVGIYYSKKSGGAAKRFEPDPQEWTLIRTVTPDENAYYIVQNLPPGRYMIVADIPGYELTGGYTVDAEEGEALHDNNFFVNDYAQVITISNNPTSAPSQENVTWAVYPNPSQGETHISGAAGGTLTVFTATGATVHTRKITAQDETVSLTGLPSGLYFFRITDKNGKQRTIKIINN